MTFVLSPILVRTGTYSDRAELNDVDGREVIESLRTVMAVKGWNVVTEFPKDSDGQRRVW